MAFASALPPPSLLLGSKKTLFKNLRKLPISSVTGSGGSEVVQLISASSEPLLLRRPSLPPASFSSSTAIHHFNEGGKKQVRWETQHTKVLCKFMAEQSLNGMKVDKNFKSTCYRQAAKHISEEFGVDVNGDNVRSHVRTLSERWNDIATIIKNGSGISVDYEMGIISMDDETAKDLIRQNKRYEMYINRFIDNFNEMSLMFADDKATGEYAQGSNTMSTQPPAIDICEDSIPSFAPTIDLDDIAASVGDEAAVRRKEGPSSSSKGKKPWKRSRGDDEELREMGNRLSSAIENAGKEMSKDRDDERNSFVTTEVMKFGKQMGIGSRDLFAMGKVLLERPGDMKMFISINDDDLRSTWLQIFYEDWCAGLF